MRVRIGSFTSVKRTTAIKSIPDDLPDAYTAMWPELSCWPDAIWIRQFVRSTRKDPAARLAILTGLRRYSSVQLGTAWAGIATYLAVTLSLVGASAGIGGALPPGWAWAAWTLTVVVSATLAIFVIRLMTLTVETEERRRSAHAWLAAVEDEIRRTRRR